VTHRATREEDSLKINLFKYQQNVTRKLEQQVLETTEGRTPVTRRREREKKRVRDSEREGWKRREGQCRSSVPIYLGILK
jgi:hypothetical protein